MNAAGEIGPAKLENGTGDSHVTNTGAPPP